MYVAGYDSDCCTGKAVCDTGDLLISNTSKVLPVYLTTLEYSIHSAYGSGKVTSMHLLSEACVREK